MKQVLLIIAVASTCILADATLWYLHHPVILRLSDGFFPSIVHIKKGETVTFFDLSSRPMWPASSPHPAHTGYPAFDPQTLIRPWHAWSFTFPADGAYPFHDHLAPQMVGVVIVGEKDISRVADESVCRSIEDEQQRSSCIELYFRNVSETASYAQARTIYEDIAVRYPNSCHNFAHDLGKTAYREYLDGNLPEIGQEASSCAYGLWHGFTTAMQEDRGFAESKEFCSSLTGANEELQTVNRMNCYHGIGIGLIPDPPPPEEWGDFQSVTEPGLAFCDTVGGDPLYRERCLTGIYHAMTTYMVNSNYGFTFDDDSLGICATQKPEHQYTCFITLASAVPIVTKHDLARTTAIVRKYSPSPEIFNDIYENAAIMSVNIEFPIEETGHFIGQCGDLGEELRAICISAVLNNYFSNGSPGIEYVKAFAFCSGPWLFPPEAQACFDRSISYASRLYSPERLPEVCSAIPEGYRTGTAGC